MLATMHLKTPLVWIGKLINLHKQLDNLIHQLPQHQQHLRQQTLVDHQATDKLLWDLNLQLLHQLLPQHQPQLPNQLQQHSLPLQTLRKPTKLSINRLL